MSPIIVNYVYNHPILLKRIDKLVPSDLRDDMRSHLVIILDKMDEEKITVMYNNGELIKYMMKILYYQLSPKCNNCFHQMYYQKIIDGSQYVDSDYGKFEIESDIELPEIRKEMLIEALNYVKQIDPSHKGLQKYLIFYQSYVGGYSNKEISKMNNKNIRTVINYKTKLLKDIKKYLIDRGYKINDKDDFNNN